MSTTLQALRRQGAERLMGLSATAGSATEGAATPLTPWQHGAWQDRRLVETGLAMLMLVRHCQAVIHCVWTDGHARLACLMAAWHGLAPR
jgi:hypothetical protein